MFSITYLCQSINKQNRIFIGNYTNTDKGCQRRQPMPSIIHINVMLSCLHTPLLLRTANKEGRHDKERQEVMNVEQSE